MADKFVDMMIDGKLTKVSQKTLDARAMKQKKVEVEINGKVLRVPEHMVEDMQRFGASLTKRTVKNPPQELLNMVPKKVVKPEDKLPEEPEPLKTIIPPPTAIKKPVSRKKK